MTTQTLIKTQKSADIERFKTKAAILDELLELIEDKYLGFLMSATEKEKNIPLEKAKKLLK